MTIVYVKIQAPMVNLSILLFIYLFQVSSFRKILKMGKTVHAA